MAILTLLTDFGSGDYYVAAVKGTVLRLAPGTTLVDISHDLDPGDLVAAGFVLAAAFPAFPPGAVHLAVVDPGVGSERRILVAERDGSYLVAPDNGLLDPLLEGAELTEVRRDDLYLDAPGATFHGRDRFAPVAAYLLTGGERRQLGPALTDPVRLPHPPAERRGDELAGRVVHVDRFGNLVTDLPTSWIGDGAWEAVIGEHRAARVVTCYAELAPGEAGIVPGSVGTLELSLAGESLAASWGVERGAAVVVRRLG